MRQYTILIVLMMAMVGRSQPPQTLGVEKASHDFNGRWWSSASSEERSGFINGVADCLTWSAHITGFNATPEQLTDKITKFYKEHPESSDVTVVDVWRRTAEKPSTGSRPTLHGETWNNPHWYLDGFWWRAETSEGKKGFVEGYLWCMRTHVSVSSETYSKSVNFYAERIDAFVDSNGASKANREAVATIFRRYRDKASSATEKGKKAPAAPPTKR